MLDTEVLRTGGIGLDGVGRVRQQQAASRTENLGKGPCSLFKVHPLDSAHATMAGKVMEEVHVTGVVNPCWAVSPPTAREPVRPRVREIWTEAAPTVENGERSEGRREQEDREMGSRKTGT